MVPRSRLDCLGDIREVGVGKLGVALGILGIVLCVPEPDWTSISSISR